MCLGIPGKVVSIFASTICSWRDRHSGVVKRACLEPLPSVVGDIADPWLAWRIDGGGATNVAFLEDERAGRDQLQSAA
jgi:hypothetical protein